MTMSQCSCWELKCELIRTSTYVPLRINVQANCRKEKNKNAPFAQFWNAYLHPYHRT